MPSKRISAFVARKKLVELQAARARLSAAYRALEDEARGRAPLDALTVLADGLGRLQHGNGRVHPEVVNLEVILGDPLADHARWLGRLEEEMRRGRARADAISLYGGALGEWLAPERARHVPSEALLGELKAAWFRPSPATVLWDRVAPRLDPERTLQARALVAERSAQMLEPGLAEPGTPSFELLGPAGRADARSLPANEIDPEVLEFRGAFRLAWADVCAWDWPDRGISLQATWTGQRFRLRPRMDYVTACTVEAIGNGLRQVLAPWSGRLHRERRLRLQRLEELSAPQIILDNERQLLAEHPDPLGTGGGDLGAEGSMRRVRADQSTREVGDYVYGGLHGMQMAVLWNDVQVARVTRRPLHVFKTDIADFFPSVSHGLVDALLAGLGVGSELRALVLRVLSVRQADGTRTTCGLPLDLALSRVLAELLVEVVTSEVHASAPVEVQVLVDDIVLSSEDPDALSRARQALVQALGDAGLALNPEKTGTFVRGAPAAGPPVQWGVLALGDGWTLAAEPFRVFLEATRTHVAAEEALLDRISAWRNQQRYLWTWLAPALSLGPRHLETVRAALDALVSLPLPARDGTEHPGITAMLKYELRHRFLDGAGATIPTGWLHWPISAGGLGLPYPPAEIVPLTLGAATQAEPEMPDPSVGLADPAWGTWYAQRLVPLAPVLPAASPMVDAFVGQFLQRGARLGQVGGELSPYWRWVLTTFGPDVVDAYGSIDFVATDLVPVGLIRESLGRRRTKVQPASDDVPF